MEALGDSQGANVKGPLAAILRATNPWEDIDLEPNGLGPSNYAALFQHCAQIVEDHPDCAPARKVLGKLLLSTREFASAGAQFEHALKSQANDAETHHDLAQVLFQFGEIDSAIEHLDRACEDSAEADVSAGVADASPASVSARLLTAVYAPGDRRVSPREILIRRKAAAAALAQNVSGGDSAGDRPAPRRHGGPLRIGYVSAHFDQANYMKPVWGAVNRHDREHFGIEFFSDAAGDPQAAGYVSNPRDQWHDVQGMTNSALVDLIRGRRLDVIVDLNAYSYVARLGIWLAPLAPANVAWFNMYATSGLPAFDYLIGDRIVYQPHEASLFSEKVHVLPCSYLTFSSLYPTPDVAPPPCLERGYFTLGCLAPQYKITDETLAVWAEMLRRLPTCRLLVRNRLLERPNNREYARMRMRDAGLPMERVELLGPAGHHEFLATYDRIDLALDTFPYNGGSTTMESLLQGVPVACFTGDRWGARISASLMHFANLDEFVANNQAEHVEQVVRLVQDADAPQRLSALRAGMRERLSQASVCDSSNLAKELERFYRKISAQAG